MTILVSDTSVLIDLERGGLLEAAFSCGLAMVVPDLLYSRELGAERGGYLRSLGLGVVALSPDDLKLAQVIKNTRPVLSLVDSFALCYARRNGYTLLTGDKNLRMEAEANSVKVFGLLWLLDQMEASGRVVQSMLRKGLVLISGHVKCRLPKDEVRARLARWDDAAYQ